MDEDDLGERKKREKREGEILVKKGERSRKLWVRQILNW